MPFDVDDAVRSALLATVPDVPLRAICARAARSDVRERTRRGAFAFVATVLSIAGLVFAFGGKPAAWPERAPVPIASTTPAPAIT